MRRKWTLFGALIGLTVAVGVMGFVRAERAALDCTPSVTPGEWSTARHWNEAALDAIRRDLPAPTVRARNLRTQAPS